MFKGWRLPLILLTAVSCTSKTQKQFEVTGSIANAPGKMVYLEETPLTTGQRIVTDSAVIGHDGSYRLKGEAKEESLFSLFLKGENYPVAVLVNDADRITVKADVAHPDDYQVAGSAASIALHDFSIDATRKWSELYVLGKQMDSLKNAGAPDSLLLATNQSGEQQLKVIQDYVRRFITGSQDPITSIWALGTYAQVFSQQDYQAILNSIVKKFPDHSGVKLVKQMNDRQLALQQQRMQQPQQAQWVNQQAPELKLPDINGHDIRLSSFKGKYVLVDFWASWCLPCRQENPNVVKAFNKYKDRNFTVLGVSLDREKDDWLQAIRKDNLQWTQVSDLKEWKSVAVSTFDFDGIPFNVLVDPTGKIIAQSLRGEELDQKLAEVLH